MGKKVRKHKREMEFDPYEDFDDAYDGNIGMGDLSSEFLNTNRDDYSARERDYSERRKMGRRRNAKRRYSELDDWEEFGELSDW